MPRCRPLQTPLSFWLAAPGVAPATAATAQTAAWRFEGLERLYFERLEDPGAAHDEVPYPGELRRLLPPTLAEGEGMTTEPRVVTDLDGPIHDGLEIRDLHASSDEAQTNDDSLIFWMLSLSPTRRLAMAQGFVDSVMTLRNGRRL